MNHLSGALLTELFCISDRSKPFGHHIPLPLKMLNEICPNQRSTSQVLSLNRINLLVPGEVGNCTKCIGMEEIMIEVLDQDFNLGTGNH